MKHQADRLTYPNTSPLPEVELIRVRPELPPDFHELLPTYVGQVAARSWCEAPWARMALGLPWKDSRDIGPYGMRHFPMKRRMRQPLVEANRQMVVDAQDPSRNQAAWVAIPKGYDVSQSKQRHENPVVGFMVSREVPIFATGKEADRLPQPQSGTRAEIVSGAVLDGWQGQRIGTALFDTSLAGFDDEAKPAATVYGHNYRAIHALKNVGFTFGEIGHRQDVLDRPVLVYTLEAGSVGEVRQRLVESFPWLQQSVQES